MYEIWREYTLMDMAGHLISPYRLNRLGDWNNDRNYLTIAMDLDCDNPSIVGIRKYRGMELYSLWEADPKQELFCDNMISFTREELIRLHDTISLILDL